MRFRFWGFSVQNLNIRNWSEVKWHSDKSVSLFGCIPKHIYIRYNTDLGFQGVVLNIRCVSKVEWRSDKAVSLFGCIPKYIHIWLSTDLGVSMFWRSGVP